MNWLVVYDVTGFVLDQRTGAVREPVGVPFLWVEIPEGKRLKEIDVSNEAHTPVFEDLPKSQVAVLQEQVNSLNIAMAQILGM